MDHSHQSPVLIDNTTGANLVGTIYKPVFGKIRCSVLTGRHVTSESGTGLVHTAPAHGPDDYATWHANNQTADILCPVDSEGRFTNAVGSEWSRLVGKEVLGNGNIEVIKILAQSGLLVKKQSLRHRYPYDWKTKSPVIFRWDHTLFYHFKTYPIDLGQHLNGLQT